MSAWLWLLPFTVRRLFGGADILQSSSSLDETDDQPATETSSQSRWMRVVEDAIDRRSKAAKMKRPAAAVPESKPKKIEPTKAVKKDKEPLKMDRKNLHSRTYTAAKLKGLKEGMTLEDACEKASKVAAAELKKHGYEPHPKKGQAARAARTSEHRR